MRITIVNGNSLSQNTGFEDYMLNLVKELEHEHQVDCIHLSSLQIEDCVGCFGCWQKTPGKCIHKDDMEQIYVTYMRSDLVLLASPLIMGFPSVLLKRFHDRLIPLIHPYMELFNGEARHKARYSRYPNMGLLLAKETDTDEDDINIVTSIYQRIAINFHSPFVYSTVIDDKTPEVVAHEISHY